MSSAFCLISPAVFVVITFPPSLSSLPPTGSSADSAARPHTVGSGQAPRSMMRLLEMNLKAVEMR